MWSISCDKLLDIDMIAREDHISTFIYYKGTGGYSYLNFGSSAHQRVNCPVLTASKDLQAWRWLPQWGHDHAGIFAARGNPHDLTFGARLRAETRARRAPYLRKFGNPSIREILVITWPYARPSTVRTTGIQCKITRLTGMTPQTTRGVSGGKSHGHLDF